ncbi:MAG: hypothetical protein LBJ09_02895 [Clostridiales bacterium]|jgi:hypothetical protein|nr:hypothetical protein [Clostridiales bacterium]
MSAVKIKKNSYELESQAKEKVDTIFQSIKSHVLKILQYLNYSFVFTKHEDELVSYFTGEIRNLLIEVCFLTKVDINQINEADFFSKIFYIEYLQYQERVEKFLDEYQARIKYQDKVLDRFYVGLISKITVTELNPPPPKLFLFSINLLELGKLIHYLNKYKNLIFNSQEIEKRRIEITQKIRILENEISHVSDVKSLQLQAIKKEFDEAQQDFLKENSKLEGFKDQLRENEEILKSINPKFLELLKINIEYEKRKELENERIEQLIKERRELEAENRHLNAEIFEIEREGHLNKRELLLYKMYEIMKENQLLCLLQIKLTSNRKNEKLQQDVHNKKAEIRKKEIEKDELIKEIRKDSSEFSIPQELEVISLEGSGELDGIRRRIAQQNEVEIMKSKIKENEKKITQKQDEITIIFEGKNTAERVCCKIQEIVGKNPQLEGMAFKITTLHEVIEITEKNTKEIEKVLRLLSEQIRLEIQKNEEEAKQALKHEIESERLKLVKLESSETKKQRLISKISFYLCHNDHNFSPELFYKQHPCRL